MSMYLAWAKLSYSIWKTIEEATGRLHQFADDQLNETWERVRDAMEPPSR